MRARRKDTIVLFGRHDGDVVAGHNQLTAIDDGQVSNPAALHQVASVARRTRTRWGDHLASDDFADLHAYSSREEEGLRKFQLARTQPNAFDRFTRGPRSE